MNSKQLPFYLIAAALFLGITGPALFSDGMFIDGLLYAGVSRNLALNLGSFWDLHMTKTLYPHFHGHPPLAFGLQSLFFKVFGDGMYVERMYSLLTYVISGWILTRIWRMLAGKEYHSYAWLPLLIWVTIPLVTWGSANNMLENTMMIFTGLSVLFLIKSLEARRFLYLGGAGLMLLFAVLTKGVVALFPLSFLFWVMLLKRDLSRLRFLIDLAVVVIAMVVPLLLVFIIQPESLESLKAYYHEQMVKSIDIQTVNSRFYIVWRLVKELLPAAVLILVVMLSTYRSRIPRRTSKWIYICLLLGLSGVLPIMVSMKQSGFYMIPALPFFSLAVALYVLPRVSHLLDKFNLQHIGFKIFKIASYTILAASFAIALSQVNKIGRDRKMIHDVNAMVELIPPNVTISVQNDLWTSWYLHGYFNRYARISLEEQKRNEHKYMIVYKGFEGEFLSNYELIEADLILYDLYVKNDSNWEQTMNSHY